MNIIDQILTADHDAKPVTDSLSARGLVTMALAALLPSLASSVGLSPDDATQAISAVGQIAGGATALIGIVRRADVRLPAWVLRLFSRGAR